MKRRFILLAAFALMALMTPLGAKGQDYTGLTVRQARNHANDGHSVQFTGYVAHFVDNGPNTVATLYVQDNDLDGAGIEVFASHSLVANVQTGYKISVTATKVLAIPSDYGNSGSVIVESLDVTSVTVLATNTLPSVITPSLQGMKDMHYPATSIPKIIADPFQSRLVRLNWLKVVQHLQNSHFHGWVVEDLNGVRDTLSLYDIYPQPTLTVGTMYKRVVAVNTRCSDNSLGGYNKLRIRSMDDLEDANLVSIWQARHLAGTNTPVSIMATVVGVGLSKLYLQDNDGSGHYGGIRVNYTGNDIHTGDIVALTASQVLYDSNWGHVYLAGITDIAVVGHENNIYARSATLETLKSAHYPATEARVKNDQWQHNIVKLANLTVVELISSLGGVNDYLVENANGTRDTLSYSTGYGTLQPGMRLASVKVINCRESGNAGFHYTKLYLQNSDNLELDLKTIQYARTHPGETHMVEGVVNYIYGSTSVPVSYIQDNTGGISLNRNNNIAVGDRLLVQVTPHDNPADYSRVSSYPTQIVSHLASGESITPIHTNFNELMQRAYYPENWQSDNYDCKLVELTDMKVMSTGKHDDWSGVWLNVNPGNENLYTIQIRFSKISDLPNIGFTQEQLEALYNLEPGTTITRVTGPVNFGQVDNAPVPEIWCRTMDDIEIYSPDPRNISISVFPSEVATNNPGAVYAASYPGGPAITEAQPGQTVYVHCPEYVDNEGITYMNSANANLSTYPHLWRHDYPKCSTHPNINFHWFMNSEWTSFTMPTSDIAFEVLFYTVEDSWAGYQRNDVWEAREGATDINANPKLTYLRGVVTRISGNNYTIADVTNANVGDDELKSECAITMWLTHDHYNLQKGDEVNVYGYPKAMGGKIYLEDPHVISKWSPVTVPFTTTDLVAINTDRNQSGAPRTSRLQDRLVHLNDITIVSKTTDGLYRVKQRCNNVDYEADLYTPNNLELNPSSTMSMLVFNGSTPNANFTLPILYLDSEDDIIGANDITIGTYSMEFDEFGTGLNSSGTAYLWVNVPIAIGSNLINLVEVGNANVSYTGSWIYDGTNATIEPLIVQNKTQLRFCVPANPTSETRTCSITIHAGSVSSQPLVITQSGCAPAEFTVSPTTITVDNDDHSWKTVQVTDIAHVANLTAPAATLAKVNTGDGTDWLTLESWNASTQTFRFHTSDYNDNTATAPRSAKISVTMTGTDGTFVTHEVTVNQNPPGASMEIVPGEWSIGLVPMCVPQTQTFTVSYQNADPNEYPNIWLEADANNSYFGTLTIEPEFYTNEAASGSVTFTVTYTATDVFADAIYLQGRLGSYGTDEGATSAQSTVYAVGLHPFDINEKVTSTEMFLSGPTNDMGDITLIPVAFVSESQQKQAISEITPEGYISSDAFNPQDVNNNMNVIDLGGGLYRIAVGPATLAWDATNNLMTSSQDCQTDTPIADTPEDCKWSITFDGGGNAIISPNANAAYSIHCKQYSYITQDPNTGEDITMYEYRFECVTTGGSAVQIFRHIDGDLPEPTLSDLTDYFSEGQAVTFTLTPPENMGVVYSLNDSDEFQYATEPVTLTVTETTKVSASSYLLCDTDPWPGQIEHTYYMINTIAEARANSSESNPYCIHGIVSCADHTHDRYFVQDETDGIEIALDWSIYEGYSMNHDALVALQYGDEVVLKGWVDQYGGFTGETKDYNYGGAPTFDEPTLAKLSEGNTVEPAVVTLATLASEAGAAYSNMLVKVCNVPVSKESEWSEFYRISEGEEFMDFPDELENAPIDEYTMQAEKIQLANGQIIDLTAIYLDGGFNNPKEVTVKTPRGYDMQAYTDVDLSQPNTEWDSHIWICDAYGNAVSPSALYAGDKVYFTFDEGYGVGYNNYLMPVAAVFSDATGQLIADTYTNFEMSVTYMNNSRDRLFSFDMPDEDVVIRVYLMNAYTLAVYNNDLTQVYNNVTLYFGSVNTMGIPESWLDNYYMTAGDVATGEAINMPYTLTANTTLTSVYQHGDEKYGRVFYQNETMTNFVVERPSVVLSDVTLTLGDLTSTNAADFVIEEGGSVDILSTEMSDNRLATVRRSIVGYGDDINVKNGWYLISTPFCEEIDPASVTNMIPNTADNYDLYTFSQSNNMAEWRNYKAQGSNVMLKPMEGQLYANKTDVELSMAGNLMAAPREIVSGPAISLSYTAGNQFAGWNLVGNPFLVEAYMKNVQNYYRLQDVLEGGVWTSKLIAETGTTPLDPMQGVFVQTDQTRWLEMVKEQPVTNNNQGLLDITVSQSTERGSSTLDRAMVRFGEGGMLGKFSFRDGGTQLYIPLGSKDYAVVSTAMQGEVPVNFKASRSGSYTISVEATNAEMEYLHLIDNLTGADVDLLVEPSYTFESHTTDYASRFRLVFSSICEDADGDNETFAYYNGSEWVIANTGRATLQVVDVMGRILNSETIDGNATARINGTPGVYMMRLVNGENVKVQKVVVR